MSISKAQWLAALESGRYKQIRGDLRGKKGTCCLGVAAVLAGAKPYSNTWFHLDGRIIITDDAGRLIEGMTAADIGDAVRFNDTKGYDFPQIAAEFRTRWGMEKATEEQA